MTSALIIIDVQLDFLPGGALAVKQGDEVVAPINRLLAERSRLFDFVVASQDWHPDDHESFASQHQDCKIGEVISLHGLPQVLWPNHCVQGSIGADFSPQLWTKRIDKIFRKGTHRDVDSYSAFFDNAHRHATGLGDWLREHDVHKVAVAGLATDYCVKFSASDAVQLGFKTTLVSDACRAVNLSPDDGELAMADMARHGVQISRTSLVLSGHW